MKKVLIVDDEEVLRKLVHDVLHDEGYQVTSVGSGTEALDKIRQDRFDLLLTDIRMPEVDGFELIQSIREVSPETISIVMTGYATLESARAAIKEGAYDYVLKPFEVSEIKMVVTNAFERKRLTEENARLRNLVSLFKVSEIISATTNLDNLLQLILESALTQTSARRGSLMLLDEKGQELTIRTSVGLDEEIVIETHVKLGEGIAGWVAKEGEPLLVTDVENHPLFQKLCRHYEDKSFISLPLPPNEESLSLPLQAKKRVIGVLNISGKKAGELFTEGDMEILSILATQAAISIENAQLFTDLRSLFLNTVKALSSAIDAKDPYTLGHSQRVTQYSLSIADELSLPPAEKENIELAGLLHDIGKIGIPDEILSKPAKLTEEEFAKIKEHPLRGAQIIAPIKQLSKVVSGVHHHHERFDGVGYPDGLSGEDIPLVARILGVADAYDAMTTDRPYRKALKKEEVVGELLKNAGTQFDKNIVTALLSIIDKG